MTNIADHARNIAFAVFRVAELVELKKLRTALESAAIDLVSQCGDLPYLPYVPKGVRLPYLPYIEKLSELVRLAEMVCEIKPVNSQVLQRELQNLYSMIAESIGKGGDINLEDIFTPLEIARPKGPSGASARVRSLTGFEKGDPSPAVQDDKIKAQDDRFKFPHTDRHSELRAAFGEPRPGREEPLNPILSGTLNPIPYTPNPSFDDAPTRQSAILEFVKRLPNGCRMKDLMAKFPSVSERTLRNDLQILVAEGKIERFGAVQGPFSYFRVKAPDEGIATRV